MANGKPFVVIYRVRVYQEEGEETPPYSKVTGEFLEIKGLGEYSSINERISVKNKKNANIEAQKIADQKFCPQES